MSNLGPRPNAVYLIQETPWPLDNGLKKRAWQLLEAIGEVADTTIISFATRATRDHDRRQFLDSIDGLTDLVEIETDVRIRNSYRKLLPCLARSFASGSPYSIEKFRNQEMLRNVRKHADKNAVNLVVSTFPMVDYAREFKNSLPFVFDSHNIEHELWTSFLQVSSFAERCFIRREASRLKKFERAAWHEASGVIAICEDDAINIKKYAASDHHVCVIPPSLSGHNLRPIEQLEAKWNGGAIGLLAQWSWAPNQVALQEFVDNLLPVIRKDSNVPIIVAGKGLSPQVCKRLNDYHVDYLGYVDDLTSFYERVDVVCAPYSVGGGVRIKVLESFCYGKPVVGYPLAFRGLFGDAATAGVECRTPFELTRSLLELAHDAEKAKKLGAIGREKVIQSHDPDQARRHAKEFLSRLLHSEDSVMQTAKAS